MDSSMVVKALHEIDPGFVVLCDTLFGKGVDPEDAWAYMYDRDSIAKMSPGSSDVSVPAPVKAGKGTLVPKPPMPMSSTPAPKKPAAPVAAAAPAPKKPMKPMAAGVPAAPVAKADDEDSIPVVWSGEFSKTDSDKRQAFGWASVVEVAGQPVVDLQGDWITPDELEKAAYTYVKKSRVGGTQHKRDEMGDPVKAGEMIESIVFTEDKISKMNLPDDFPRGWWVGFQYDDDDTWADIKSGRKTGFSVHGRGKRVSVEI